MDIQTILEFLLAGAIVGLLPGALAGAIVGPMTQAPDALGRGLLIGILLGVGMAFFQMFTRVTPLTGSSLGSILNAFQGGTSGEVGRQIYLSVSWTLVALVGGVVIGLASVVPDQVIKGGLLGLFVGAIVGGLMQVLMKELNLPYDTESAPLIFPIAVGLLSWGLMTAVSR